MDIQLLHDSISVRFCRIEADAQKSRNLFRRLAFGDELQHLTFPWRERIISGALGPDLRDDLCEVGAYIGRSTGNFADRLEQFCCAMGFQNIALSPGAERLQDVR